MVQNKWWSERQGNVLSPVLFNAMTNEIACKVRGGNKVKTLIFADHVL
jgi:hypothetical protein